MLSTSPDENSAVLAPPARRALTVLHLVSLKGMGGRAATALRQARLLKTRGHTVLMGCLPGTAIEARCRELGIEVCPEFHFSRGLRPLRFWEDCRAVARRCDAFRADVLHAHLSQESWVGCLGARMAARPPAVFRSRGVVVPVKPHLFNRWLHNRLTDCVITPSRAICDPLRALPGFDAQKVELLPDGVDVARFAQADGAAVRREFNVAPDAPLIVMVARLEPVKGHLIFFQALKRLRDGGKPAGLRAVCACDERTAGAFDATVREAREMGLGPEMLAFTGLRPDIERVLAAATVVALPSLGSEGSSRVALEAAAAGVPVVASAVGCLPEVIADGATGVLVPCADPAALAVALEKIAADPARAQEMGRAARARAAANYDELRMVERLEELYIREVARRESPV